MPMPSALMLKLVVSVWLPATVQLMSCVFQKLAKLASLKLSLWGQMVGIVVGSESDYRWAADVIRTRELDRRTEVLLSPVHGALEPQALVAWMLRDRLVARLNLQLHKYIWSPDARGV